MQHSEVLVCYTQQWTHDLLENLIFWPKTRTSHKPHVWRQSGKGGGRQTDAESVIYDGDRVTIEALTVKYETGLRGYMIRTEIE